MSSSLSVKLNNASNYLCDSINSGAKNVSNWTKTGTQWAVENKKALLVAATIAGLATMIAGLAIMGTATSLYSSIEIIAFTWDKGAFISHFAINPALMKGLATFLSGALVVSAANIANR